MKQNNNEFIDVNNILKRMLKYWYYFAISIIVFCGLGILKIKTSPKIYSVDSIMKMDVGSSNTQKLFTEDSRKKEEKNIDDEIIVIKSSEYIEETLNKLNFTISYFEKDNFVSKEVLSSNFPYQIKLDTNLNQLVGVPIYIDKLSDNNYSINIRNKKASLYNFAQKQDTVLNEVTFNGKYQFDKMSHEKYFGLNVSFNENYNGELDKDYYFIIHSPETLVSEYANKLDIEKVDFESTIIELHTEGRLVDKERKFLNTLMQVVIENDLEVKNKKDIKTIDFIDYQLAKTSKNLDEVEENMESFQYTTTQIGESSALYERRDQLESEIADLNVKLRYFENVLQSLNTVEDVSNISAPASVGVDNAILNNLLLKLTELHQQKVQLERTATEANPVVQRTNLEIKTTKKALRDNLNSAISSTNIAIENVQERLNQTNATINRLPSAQRRKTGIQRQFEFTDNTYDMLLRRKAEAGISLATNASDWKIIEKATPQDTPISPKKFLIIALSLLLGISIPVFSLIVKFYFDNKINNEDDIRRLSSIPIIGTIARGNKGQKLANEYGSKTIFRDSLRGVRYNLQFALNGASSNIIGITSTVSGEGKTFTALNLGISLTEMGKKVVMIDADLRKLNTINHFNIKSNVGLTTYLKSQDSNMDDIINKTSVEGFDVIPSGPVYPVLHELLNSKKFDSLLNDLSAKYDFVIMDVPPLGIVNDYLLIQDHIQTNIYIVRRNFSKKNYLNKINQLYNDGKIKNLNILLNDVMLDKEIYTSKNNLYVDFDNE